MTNPLIQDAKRVATGITVKLPTLGKFYDETIIDTSTNVEDAPVGKFSVWDETNFSDPYKIISGEATKTFLKTVAPWIIEPMQMSRWDIEVIMAASRLASYGPKMPFEMRCANPDETTTTKVNPDTGEETSYNTPVCGHRVMMDIDIREVIETYAFVESTDDWMVEIDTGQTLILQPPRYQDELAVSRLSLERGEMLADLGKEEEIERFSREQILEIKDIIVNKNMLSQFIFIQSCTKEVKLTTGNAVKDRTHIQEWLNTLNGKQLRTIIDKLEGLLSINEKAGKFDFVCPNCEYKTDDIPVIGDSIHFFGNGLQAVDQDKSNTQS